MLLKNETCHFLENTIKRIDIHLVKLAYIKFMNIINDKNNAIVNIYSVIKPSTKIL